MQINLFYEKIWLYNNFSVQGEHVVPILLRKYRFIIKSMLIHSYNCEYIPSVVTRFTVLINFTRIFDDDFDLHLVF